MRHMYTIAFIIGMAISSPAGAAAVVEVVQGPISVSQGDGFQPVAGTVQVGSGWSVMAGSGGQGRIVYSSGCVVEVNPGHVVAVDARNDSPGQCNKPMAKPYLLGGSDCDPNGKLDCTEEGFPLWPVGVGVGAVIIGTCIGWWCDDDGRRRHRD